MRQRFFFLYCLLVIAQLMISNYFDLSSYIMLSILPVMILCIPTRIGTTQALLIAFVIGLAIDMLAEGIVGLNILSIVPVAFSRKAICRFVFGEELIIRNDDFSIRKNGIGKVSFALVLAQSLFLLIYLVADGAASRTFLFFLGRFFASLIVGVLLSIAIVDIITTDERK